MTTDIERPPAWIAALTRFREGYGSDFDAGSASDVWCLLPLLEDEVRREIAGSIVDAFRQATAEMLSERQELRERQRDV